MLNRKTPPAEADGETNYEKNERCSQRQYDWPCVQRKTPPTKADGVLLQTASLNHNKNAMQAVQKPLLGWAQENPTCARPTMGGGVLMLPPASLGVPGWDKFKLYKDKCFGGKATRPGLDQMLQDTPWATQNSCGLETGSPGTITDPDGTDPGGDE
jgi:hypothetical protein